MTKKFLVDTSDIFIMIKWLYILLCCIIYSCKPLHIITGNNNYIAKSNGVVIMATYSNGYVLDSLGKTIATYSNGYVYTIYREPKK